MYKGKSTNGRFWRKYGFVLLDSNVKIVEKQLIYVKN